MSMASYLQGFLFKWAYTIFIILIISVTAVFLSFQINRWLPDYAHSFSNLIAQQCQVKISFKKVYFRFPNHIVLKNITVAEPSSNQPMLQASHILIDLPFKTLTIEGLKVHFTTLKNYLTHHGKRIHAWAKALPKGKLHLVIPNGRIYIKDLPVDTPISYTVDLTLDQDHFNTHGSWNGNSSFNLWGSWHADSIDWKGFILYTKFYILDIDGYLKIQENDVFLKHLSFSVNKDTVTASAHCLKQNPFQCDADIDLKNAHLHLQAQHSPQGLFFNGTVSLNGKIFYFEHLKAWAVNDSLIKLSLHQMRASFLVNGNEQDIALEDLLASIQLGNPDADIIALSAKMYDGNLYGRIFLNTSSWPWQINGQGKIKGIDINHLSDNFSSLKKCQGLLSGNLNFQAFDQIKLSGNIELHHANFNDPHFQHWIAKTLQMPSLDQVSGAELSGHFSIEGKEKMLDDVKLINNDLDLKGFFHLDPDDLVSSRISARLSKEILKESPIGRHIISLVHGAWTLPFDFSLSGNVHRMNFQWDNSPLKDKVRQHLFSFFERMIDRRMDAHPYYKVTIPNESVSPG
jgi:hypothetical protein